MLLSLFGLSPELQSHPFTASILLLMMETRSFIVSTCVLVSFLIQLCSFCRVIPIAGLDHFNYHIISVGILQNYLRKKLLPSFLLVKWVSMTCMSMVSLRVTSPTECHLWVPFLICRMRRILVQAIIRQGRREVQWV